MHGSVKVEKLRKIFEALREEDQEFPAQTAEMFIAVALKGKAGIVELGEAVGLSLGAASRNVAKLADHHNGKKGLGLVKVDWAPGSYKAKEVQLTTKGQRLLDRLTENL